MYEAVSGQGPIFPVNVLLFLNFVSLLFVVVFFLLVSQSNPKSVRKIFSKHLYECLPTVHFPIPGVCVSFFAVIVLFTASLKHILYETLKVHYYFLNYLGLRFSLHNM